MRSRGLSPPLLPLSITPLFYSFILASANGVVEEPMQAVEGTLQLSMVHAIHHPHKVRLGHVGVRSEGGLSTNHVSHIANGIPKWGGGSGIGGAICRLRINLPTGEGINTRCVVRKVDNILRVDG